MPPIDRGIKWKAGGGSNFSWQLPGGQKPKDLMMMPARDAIALQAAEPDAKAIRRSRSVRADRRL